MLLTIGKHQGTPIDTIKFCMKKETNTHTQIRLVKGVKKYEVENTVWENFKKKKPDFFFFPSLLGTIMNQILDLYLA